MVTRQMLSAAVCAAALTIAACSLAPAMMPRGYAGPVRALDSTPAVTGGDSSPPVVPTPSAGSPEPPPEAIFPHVTAVVSPGSGHPGDSIRISFVIDRPGWRVDFCKVRFRAGPTTTCPTGSGGPVDLRVPADAEPGNTSIDWTAYYRLDEPGTFDGSRHADDSAPFLVLDAASPAGSPSDPGDGRSSPVESPIGLPAGPPRTAPDSADGPSFPGLPLLLGLVVAAGGAAALVARRSRSRTAVPAPSGPMRPQAGPRIRAVARPDPAIRVTAEEPPDGRTNVVRLETHGGVVAVDVQEVSE
ncbi:hypothetical protein GCM10029978_070590 [Actinoallomurus acanthiterrae]